jgi:hypothetical protein
LLLENPGGSGILDAALVGRGIGVFSATTHCGGGGGLKGLEAILDDLAQGHGQRRSFGAEIVREWRVGARLQMMQIDDQDGVDLIGGQNSPQARGAGGSRSTPDSLKRSTDPERLNHNDIWHL